MLPLLVRFLATGFRLHNLGILPSTLLHRITRTARRRYGVEVTCYVELYSAENLKSEPVTGPWERATVSALAWEGSASSDDRAGPVPNL